MFTTEEIFRNTAIGMIVWGVVMFISLQFNHAEYGRYAKDKGYFVNNQIAWFIQELPSLAVPVVLIWLTDCPMLAHTSNRILLFCFGVHYIHRYVQ